MYIIKAPITWQIFAASPFTTMNVLNDHLPTQNLFVTVSIFGKR